MNNKNIQGVTLKKGNSLILFLIMVIASSIILAAFFLPYASATEKNRASLKAYADEPYIQEIGMNNEDAINISLFEYIKIYSFTASSEQTKNISIVCLVLIALCIVFSLLTTVFSILKKPAAVIVFDLISLFLFFLLAWDFNDRGALPNKGYDLGLSYYIFYICTAIILVCAIWLLVKKIQEKKQNKITETINIQ